MDSLDESIDWWGCAETQRRERRVVKPQNWPRYMREKRLKAGAIAYYWEPQRRDVARGCPVHAEALGPNYAGAIERAALLNRHLDAWRSSLEGTKVELVRGGYGTVAWLFDTYLKSPAFERRVSKRSAGFDRSEPTTGVSASRTTTRSPTSTASTRFRPSRV